MANAQSGSAISWLALGAIIQSFRVNGHNIVLGFSSPDDYQKHNKPYFGETIGRVANRIPGAILKGYNGKDWPLSANEGRNTLHGGSSGWGKKLFDGPAKVQHNGKEATMFKYLSPDGDEGFPGTVELRVWYAECESEGKIILEIEFEVEMVGDEVNSTAVSITNHSYFNLSDAGTIEGMEINLGTNLHLPVDDESIPTGSIEPFPGIHADKVFTIGPEEPKIDHCFIMDPDPSKIPLDTRALPMQRQATMYHPTTKVNLIIESTEPAFQFYTGDGIDSPAVGTSPARGPRAGIAFEPSRYINAVNTDEWKGMVELKKGQLYGSRLRYSAWTN